MAVDGSSLPFDRRGWAMLCASVVLRTGWRDARVARVARVVRYLKLSTGSTLTNLFRQSGYLSSDGEVWLS